MPTHTGRRALLGLALAATIACGDGLPNPENELPMGYLDNPPNGAVVPRNFTLAGWALDSSKVVRVDIYLDGRYRASTTLSVRRPDVLKAFPKYSQISDAVGWEVTVDLGEPGPRHVLAQAVDDAGATRDIGSVGVTVGK